jgi:hypothetical protein
MSTGRSAAARLEAVVRGSRSPVSGLAMWSALIDLRVRFLSVVTRMLGRQTFQEVGKNMDAAEQAWIDQHDAHISAMVRRYGWYIAYIGGGSCDCPGCDDEDTDSPPFAYTVGLFGLAHPELLIFGVGRETAANVLNGLGSEVRAGEPVLAGQMLGFEEWQHRFVPETVPNPGEIVFDANRYYQRPNEFSVAVLQLSYDDAEGRFPWEEDYADPELQPRPGMFKA